MCHCRYPHPPFHPFTLTPVPTFPLTLPPTHAYNPTNPNLNGPSMSFPPSLSTTKIIIHYYEFTLSNPREAGDSMTAAEAQALNAQRADNIRTKVEFWVREAEEASPDEILSPDDIAELEARVAELDATYSFSGFYPRNRKGLLQREREIVAGNLSAETGEDITTLLESRDDRVEWEARRRIVAQLGVLRPEDIGI